ncbi:unnamed protein product, partial [Gongylonema pulchrum]|uniref:DUF4332 domain-containing protein n=1 Tax=Gongylonema pulchrum TaxID=637853 RepID=A0A183F0Y8_9BILA
MLEDLDKATLIDLGVNTIGDQVRTFGIKTVDALGFFEDTCGLFPEK